MKARWIINISSLIRQEVSAISLGFPEQVNPPIPVTLFQWDWRPRLVSRSGNSGDTLLDSANSMPPESAFMIFRRETRTHLRSESRSGHATGYPLIPPILCPRLHPLRPGPRKKTQSAPVSYLFDTAVQIPFHRSKLEFAFILLLKSNVSFYDKVDEILVPLLHFEDTPSSKYGFWIFFMNGPHQGLAIWRNCLPGTRPGEPATMRLKLGSGCLGLALTRRGAGSPRGFRPPVSAVKSNLIGTRTFVNYFLWDSVHLPDARQLQRTGLAMRLLTPLIQDKITYRV